MYLELLYLPHLVTLNNVVCLQIILFDITTGIPVLLANIYLDQAPNSISAILKTK